jgi:hypothetical protein
MADDPHKVFRDVVIEAQRILARPIEPHGPDRKTTISALRDVFDGPAVRSALSATGAPPARPVTRPSRSSATRSIDNSLGGFLLHW